MKNAMTNGVTVLLPVYNGQRFLAESIESILQQEFAQFELLIIDDGSTDGSMSIIKKFRDPRIHILSHKQNKGLICTLNHGLAEARYELVARHDQDDIALPKRLRTQVRYLEQHPDVGVCGTGAYVRMGNRRVKKIIFPSSDAGIRWALLFYSPLIHPSVMYRKSVIKQVDGYSMTAEAHYVEDYELWLKLLAVTKFHNIHQPLMELRKHENNMTVARQAFHMEQTVAVTKRHVEKMLNQEVPIDFIRWLRAFPEESQNSLSNAKYILALRSAFSRQNALSFFEKAQVLTRTCMLVASSFKDGIMRKKSTYTS